MAVFKKMHALQPEGRTVSSWEHLFRPLKVKAKEMVKEKGGDDVSDVLTLFLRCKMEDAEGLSCGIYCCTVGGAGVVLLQCVVKRVEDEDEVY